MNHTLSHNFQTAKDEVYENYICFQNHEHFEEYQQMFFAS